MESRGTSARKLQKRAVSTPNPPINHGHPPRTSHQARAKATSEPPPIIIPPPVIIAPSRKPSRASTAARTLTKFRDLINGRLRISSRESEPPAIQPAPSPSASPSPSPVLTPASTPAATSIPAPTPTPAPSRTPYEPLPKFPFPFQIPRRWPVVVEYLTSDPGKISRHSSSTDRTSGRPIPDEQVEVPSKADQKPESSRGSHRDEDFEASQKLAQWGDGFVVCLRSTDDLKEFTRRAIKIAREGRFRADIGDAEVFSLHVVWNHGWKQIHSAVVTNEDFFDCLAMMYARGWKDRLQLWYN